MHVQFLLGMNTLAALVIGVFFLRFWRKSRDTLFLWFALAFWILGGNWGALAFQDREEPSTALYLLRLVAFALIILGILHKNRAASARTR